MVVVMLMVMLTLWLLLCLDGWQRASEPVMHVWHKPSARRRVLSQGSVGKKAAQALRAAGVWGVMSGMAPPFLRSPFLLLQARKQARHLLQDDRDFEGLAHRPIEAACEHLEECRESESVAGRVSFAETHVACEKSTASPFCSHSLSARSEHSQ